MKIRCLLVDDELPALDELAYILSGIHNVEVVGTATSAGKAITAIRKIEPDLVFLDIQMPGRDGFEVIKACSAPNMLPFFIFSTAYDQHAVKAFEANAVDYILKPFQLARVRESIDRAGQMLLSYRQGTMCEKLERFMERFERPKDRASSIVPVVHNGRILLLDPDEIIFFKTVNKHIAVHTAKQCFDLHGVSSLDELEAKLNQYPFFRTHRGYLVNLCCVKEVVPWFNGRYILTAKDKTATEIPVSRTRVKTLKLRLGI